VRAAQERLAREAEDSLTGLRKANPKNQQEMQAAVNQVAVAVTAKDGNVDADAKAVQADVKKACGFSITSPPPGS
jgi:tellurite resistance protein